jgi:hypothetical protein
MTIGIYAIYFEALDKVYIGQSEKIETRVISHKSLFKSGHPNYKLARAYNKDSNPSYIILQECTISELDRLESEWITEFDAIHSGLNIASGGVTGNRGTNSGKSKFSKEQLELSFDLLCDPAKTINEIVEISGVSKIVLGQICAKSRHIWLHELYPDKSALVISNKHNRFSAAQVNRFKTNVILISPEGVEYTCTNRNKFAIEHGLNSGHLGAVIRNEEPQHKGWKLKKGGSDE